MVVVGRLLVGVGIRTAGRLGPTTKKAKGDDYATSGDHGIVENRLADAVFEMKLGFALCAVARVGAPVAASTTLGAGCADLVEAVITARAVEVRGAGGAPGHAFRVGEEGHGVLFPTRA